MEKFFKIKERGSTLKTEIFAGITTFFAMAYIIFVNPNQVAAEGANGWLVGLGADPGTMGQIWNSVYIASIIVAIIGTLLMAFVADMPFAQACGMGLNSFFCTIFVAGSFFAGEDVKTGYQAGLVIVFLSGIVFLLLSVTGLRKYIAVSMPECLKKAIPAGTDHCDEQTDRNDRFQECRYHRGQPVHICTVLRFPWQNQADRYRG